MQMATPRTSPNVSISPGIEAEMMLAVKAFVLALVAQLEARIADLEKRVEQLSAKSPQATPKNSSVPSSTVTFTTTIDCLVCA